MINSKYIFLQDFYDLDIIDEEVLIEWGGHPSKKYVPKDLSRTIHEKAAPVIKWLQEADEESSEEEEDEVRILCNITQMCPVLLACFLTLPQYFRQIRCGTLRPNK